MTQEESAHQAEHCSHHAKPSDYPHPDMKTMADFLELMTLARDKRRTIVLSLLFKDLPKASNEELELAALLRRLDASSQSNKMELELCADKSIHMDVKDELCELRKDLAFLTEPQGPQLSFQAVLRLCQGEASPPAELEEEAESIAALIRDAVPNLILITDWDGTMKNYGSNYSTCMQPAYSAVILCRFARACTRFAAVLTAGPLRQPGILDLTAVPVSSGFLAYGGCWGREWLVHGQRYVQDSHISTESRLALTRFTERMQDLINSSFPVFRYIGSGIQVKVDRVTFGIQNVSGCVSNEETEQLVSAIEGVIADLDPDRKLFHIDRSNYDLEVILNEATSGVWDKGSGVAYLEELQPPGLELTGEATVLVCGDTASDLPMVRCLLHRNPDRVRAVFVNASQAVRDELARLFVKHPQSYLCVSCPQAIHYAMVKLLNERAGTLDESYHLADP